MEISEEQSKQIKEQLIKQINTTFPEDKKESAKQQVNSMDDEQLKEFLKQNNLVKNQKSSQCILCSIVYGETSSVKIGENEKAVAILEINPISKGHSLIIPKEHLEKKEDLPDEALQLAKEIAEKLKVLNPKKIELIPANILGHEVINVLPVYSDETLESEKHSAKKEELENLKEQLENPPKKQEPKQEEEEEQPKEEINEKNTWLPKRIP